MLGTADLEYIFTWEYSMTIGTTVTISALSMSTVKVPTIRTTAASILWLGYLPLEYLLLEYTQCTVCQGG